METSTFNTTTETEAIALANYFNDCGFSANRKGKVVKVKGASALVEHLYEVFVQLAVL